MNFKGLYCMLIALVALLSGFAGKQTVDLPNQAIVLQIQNGNLDSVETQNAIASIKERLLDVGVANIQVTRDVNGNLKISYHSSLDIFSIRQSFSEDEFLLNVSLQNEGQAPNPIPSDGKNSCYNLDIYEIQTANELPLTLQGKLARDNSSDTIRPINPQNYVSADIYQYDDIQYIETIAYHFHKSNALSIDNTSHKIPEVRAGPLSLS